MNNKTEMILPADPPMIPALQYARNQELTSLIVSEGVEVLGPKAFSQCKNLRTVWLPRSLTHIDMKCFERCPLEEIHYAGSLERWMQLEISPQGAEGILAARKFFQDRYNSSSVISAPGEGRKQEILQMIRGLLSDKGDGRLHIIVPELCVDHVLTKPGDMTLLIFPHGSTMLIDTGHKLNRSKALGFIREIGLSHLNYFAFSHADEDHVTNAQEIADFICREQGGSIQNFWWTGQAYGTVIPPIIDYLRAQGTSLYLCLRAGQQYQIDGVQVDILGPAHEDMLRDVADQENRNSQSMIMKFTFGSATYLTCGDLYAEQERIVVRRFGQMLRADVCKTNHHGCFTSNTADWLDAVCGKIVFTCSNDNGNTVLEKEMERRGVDYCSTGCQGTIFISADASGTYNLTTQYGRDMRCIQRVN